MIKRTDDETILRLKENGKTGREIAAYFGVSPAYISKRLKRLQPIEEPPSLAKLRPEEKKFVLAKVDGRNNMQAAMIAYDVKNRDSAKAMGWQKMRDPDIHIAIQDLMAQEGIGRRRRIQRLRDVIEARDLNTVAKGVDLAFKPEGLYGQDAPIVQISFNELMDEVQDIDAQISRYELALKKLRDGQDEN
jgi:transcriptional regulator with XRE-family HTH domain